MNVTCALHVSNTQIALQMEPTWMKAYYRKAIAHSQMGDLRRAYKAYSEAKEVCR
jgi:hypothetical protein